MNENILVVLLIVITLALIAIVSIVIAIFYKLVGHFNDMDHQYISIHKNDTEAYDIKGKPDDGTCRDCMFVFKPYYEEPCNKCKHAYGTKFVSRRNKE